MARFTALILAAFTVAIGAQAADDTATALPVPQLPAKPYEYANVTLPPHLLIPDRRYGNAIGADNTPADNPITNAGAALGRVLFYDKRLSANDTTSCSSCHQQKHGFSDPEKLSKGLHGKRTKRRSMGLTNARFYAPGRFFWDERAATLEDQVLMPIQDEIEMGMNLDDLEIKLRSVDFYPPLFEAAFGTPEINRNRISRALAQFVRSLVSFQSKYDQAFAGGGGVFPTFQKTFNQQELLGQQLFSGGFGVGRSARCDRCHGTTSHISLNATNNGLDLNTDKDNGAGGGRFKAPSLRNVAVRAPYMHDGRFKNLHEVIEHYNSGVQNHLQLDRSLSGRRGRGRGGRRGRRGGGPQNETPERLNLSNTEINALVAFLHTLTDNSFLNDPRFSDPFADPEQRLASTKHRTPKPKSKPDLADDAERAANREKLASKALKKVRAATEPRIKTAKLMLIVKRFAETKAANEAQTLLDATKE